MKKHYYKNGKFVFLLFVLLSLLALKPNQVMAQTLKTDGIVPALDACGASGTFTVAIAKGTNACNAGTLQIALPTTGFEYVAGSAKTGTTALAETNVTATGATLTLPAITSGVATDLVTITYQVRATCEAIPMATLPDDSKPTVTYTLNGCSATAQTGQSDIININFAVLKVEVNPNASQGVIGSSITRTIKVTNNGNGSLNSFTIERTLGASLSVASVTQPVGWAVDATNPNKYIYTGATLAPGASVLLTETVKINACTALQTTFDAYYGCVGKCTLGNANGTITAGISIDQSIQPNLQVTVNTTPVINCYNQEYEHVWTIKNNGTGVSSATKLFMYLDGSPAQAGSYFNENSITVGGSLVTINASDTQLILATSGGFGTEGKIRQLSINIPDLAPGESREIRFKQYYAAPVADCTKDLNSFFRAYTAYSSTYKHRDGCNASGTNPDINLAFTQVNNDVHYGFSGTNVGEVDIVSGYNADFLINNWDVGLPDIHPGAYFDVILQLSAAIQPGFDISAIKLFDPQANKYLTPVVTNLGAGKYQLRINYGGADWQTGTRFNSGSYHLQFPVTLSCAAGSTAAYTVLGQLNNGGGCTDLLQFACQTVALNAHCGNNCPDGGLDNGAATLKRMTYGQVATNPDAATPDLSAPTVDPNNPPANFATRYFIGTDKLQISQTGKVVNGNATPIGGWIAGTFSVASPADLKSIAVPNTGKVTITRGTNVYTVSGLPINTNVADNFSIDLGIINLLTSTNNLPVGFTYQDNDVIVSSLEIQPMELINSSTGIKEFPTTYNMSSGGVGYSCNNNFRATGYYGPTWLQFFTGGNIKITSCDPTLINNTASPSFLFLFREIEYWRNLMFPNEFRQVAMPKKAIFTMPEGLQLVAARVDINNNSITGNLSKTITLPAPVSNGTYTLDVAQAIIDLKGGAYLDEGWEVRIYPMVQPTCKSTGADETILIEGFMEGTFWHRYADYREIQFRNSPEVSVGQIGLTYQTDNHLLSATVTQANVLATTSQSKWVVQVANSSAFRKFSNVWMGQSASTSGANIVSVQQVTDLNGTTPIGATTTAVNGVFQLGDFNTGATGSKYYLVTADYSSCDPGNIGLVYGADCNGYPTSVASATCSTTLATLNYTPVFANLQTSIVSQNAGTARPKLCEQIPYEIQVNNAGLGDATSLVVSVRLPLAGGLSYVPGTLQLTAPFAANAGAYSAITDASANVSPSAIVFTIPVANVPALKNGEKFLLKFDLTPQGCTFQSGQRISFTASGKNGCGSDIANTNAATSNRVTIDGAPTNLPDLSVTLASTTTNLTAAGADLTADYNFTLKNIGDGINNYPVTTAYSFNVKLPAGWVFSGNPQDLVPIAQATYVGLDPVKGYVYHLAQDLPVGAEIKIVNASMVYANATAIACDTNFGPIYESVFTTFSPQSLCVGAPCQIDQLSVDNQTTILTAPKPTAPAGAANQAFCAGNTRTLASIVVTNASVLTWYDSATSTTPIANTTVLVDGSVYYAANKLVEGGVCESDRLAVTIKLDLMPTVNAGPDQTIYTGSQFTMAGNNPVAPQTGVWTEVVATGETAQATITNPNNYNTTVNVAAGKTVTLRWTISNGSCLAFDDVVLVNIPENDLSVEKTADKSSVIAGEDLTYTITIKNAGPGFLLAGSAIGLTETLPPAFINPVYTATGGMYDAVANTFTLAAGMTTGDVVTLSIKGTVVSSFTGTNIINKVTIQAPAGVTDSNLTNNEDEVTTPVTRTTDLSVTKVADKASIVAGESLKYTITITNNGLSTLLAGEAIGVTETLPNGFSGLTYTATGGTYSVTANTFTLASALANGQSVSFTINGTVDANYNAATIVNTVVVSAPTGVTDPTPGNNTATVTTPVTRTTDLSVTKVADKGSIVAGESLKYTITITNNGLSTLLAGEAIGVTETLPNGFSGLTYTATGGTYNAATGTFTLAAAMATTQSVSFTINGTVDANYNAATIVNAVVVAPPTGVVDPTPANNTATVTTPVTRSADLAVTKTANKTSVVAGDALIYTITITNNGLSTLLAGEAIGVTETLPNGFSGLTYTATGGTYDAAGGTFTLASALANGQSVSFTISGTVDANYNAATIVNMVVVSAPTGVTDPTPENNTATVTTPVTRTTDLSVTKVADKASIVAGESLKYTITITNNGLSTLLAGEAIGVTETLPNGFSGLTYTATGGTYDAAGGTFTLAAAMANGQSVSFTINGMVDANYNAATIVNTVVVSAPTGVTDPTPGNNTATVTTPVTRTTDLSVTKVADKASIVAGESLKYTITITNNGLSTLLAGEAIGVTESLPTGFSGLTYTATGGTYNAATGTFTLAAAMATTQSVSFTINGTVDANYNSATIVNTVVVAPPTGVVDPTLANNTATVTTPVTRSADLAVTKTANKTSVVAGDALIYTITLTNNGVSTLAAGEAIGVTESLPSGFSGLTYAATGGTYSAAGSTFTLAAAMATGQSVSFTINGTVDANYNAATIVNTVVVSAPTGVTDPTLGNNTATVTTPVTRNTDLSVTKVADKASIVAGESLKYTITITNNGLSTLLAGEAIGVTESLPTGFSGLTYTATGGTYDAATGTFTLAAAMATTQSVSFTINGTVDANYNAATIVNTVVVSAPTGVTDPTPGNNTSTVTTPVTRTTDLSVTKVADKASIVAGESLKYTITITNNGLSTLLAGEAIGVTETLPTGFSGLTYTATGGTYSVTANTFTLASALANGQSVSFTINGTVDANYNASTIVNTVVVSAPTGVTDPTPGNNTATVTTPVSRSINLTVVKTADKITAIAGENLVYTIRITNNGSGTLLAGEVIRVTETLPAGFDGLTYASIGGTYNATGNSFTLASSMATGESVSFTISGTVNANYNTANIANTVTVAPPAGVVDPVPGDNTSTVTIPVTRTIDLSVVKTANQASVVAGDPLQYTITITNNGPTTLLANEAIKVTETLPTGFNGLTYASTGGTYNAAAGTFTLAATMATTQSVSFTISGTVAANYNASAIVNTVLVVPPAGVNDPTPGNNTSTVTTPVVRVTDLSVVKTANKTTVVAGEALVYTLTITNNGPSTLFANETIPVTETLPANLTGVNFASSNGVYSNGIFKLAADLPQGASVMLTVSGTVFSASAAGSSVTNVVTVATPPGVTDPVPANNTDNEVTPVNRVADLSVVKTASEKAPVVGTDFTFTIKVRNNGPSDASSVVVNDLLPSGYTYVSATAIAGSFVNTTGIWTIGNLTNGAEAKLTITVKVKPTGNYTNTATITGTETDPDLNNNSSTVTPTPQPSPPVAIDDEATTKANNSVVIAVLTNDHPGLSDSPLVPTSVQIISNPLHGTVKVNADGTVTYTPNSGYIGVDNFTYRVQDELGNWSNVANVKITIIVNELHIPNVITPNGDGKNDTFEIVGIEGYDNATLTIFNRWGNEVYKNGAYKNTWDGFGLNEGTYYYLIRLKKGSSEDNYKGWVLLKR